MVSSTPGENLVYDVRLSSVVPASITGEDKVHEFSNMDLIMKLHYLRGLYFFNSVAAQGLTIHDLKKPMFECLERYYPLSGRIRTSENGRPFIKCNDSGVRIAEAKCNKTLDEWLAFNDNSLNDHLIYSQFLGPDLGFTPLVFVQNTPLKFQNHGPGFINMVLFMIFKNLFTWFKCGGISIGLSWAHILGDALSASHFINMWGQILTGQVPHHHPDVSSIRYHNKNRPLSTIGKVPLSIQRVLLEPIGGHWLLSNHSKMQSHSFHLTAKQLNYLTQAAKLAKPFEVISAVMWKSLAKVRGKSSEPKIVTICGRNAGSWDNENDLPSNSLVNVTTIEAANLNASVAEADLLELAKLIANKQVNETNLIEEVMDQKDSDGKSHDFVLYGARLTFVNLEEIKIYEVEFRGHQPVFASYSLSGVGDEGAILVLPGPTSGKEDGGRVVNLVLPEKQLEAVKNELRKEWGIW